MAETVGKALNSWGWLLELDKFRSGIMKLLADIEDKPKFHFIGELVTGESENEKSKKVFIARYEGMSAYFLDDGSLSLISIENKIVVYDTFFTLKKASGDLAERGFTIRYCEPFNFWRAKQQKKYPLSYIRLYKTNLDRGLGEAGDDYIIEVGDPENYCEEVRKLLENKKYV